MFWASGQSKKAIEDITSPSSTLTMLEQKKLFDKAVSNDPDWEGRHETYSAYAVFLNKTKRYQYTVALCEEWLSQNVGRFDLLVEYALALYKTGRVKDAELHLKKAISNYSSHNLSDDSMSLYFLSIVQTDLRRYKDAKVSIDRALKGKKPDLKHIFVQRARVLRHLGEPIEAEAVCKMAFIFDPKLFMARIQMGYILKDLGRFDEAEEYLSQALEDAKEYKSKDGIKFARIGMSVLTKARNAIGVDKAPEA